MKNYFKILSITIVFASLLAYVAPANAYFSLTIPKQLTELWQKVQAQEGSNLAPMPTQMPPNNQQPTMQNPQPPMDGQAYQPQPMPYPQQPNQPMPYQPQQPQQPNQSGQTCLVNGVEKSGSCEQYNNQNNTGGGQSQQPNNNQQQPNMDQNNMGPNNGGQGGGDQTRMIKDMQRNAKQMESRVNSFEKQMLQAEKSGGVISQDLKDQIVKARELLAKIKGATTAEEMGDDTMNQLQEIVQNLDENGREVFQKIQQLNNVKREIKNMKRSITNFDKQIAKLVKQKIAIPQEIADNIAKLKAIVTAIEIAKTWDEVEAAGLEDMGDLMQSLGESQQSLEMLARWPQTLKQMDKELKNLTNQVKKAKTIVDRLIKKGIDLTENFTNFSSDVEKLKITRDEANNKIIAGDSQGAFDLVEDGFFYKMDEVYENQRVIETMNNLGRFNSDFKTGLNGLKKEIANLKKKGEDTSELQTLYDEVKQQGEEILVMMKAKPIDTDAIVSALEDLESIRQQSSDNIQELGGGGAMPWQQGNQQIQQLQMPKTLNQYIPQQKNNPVGESNPQPSPSPISESNPQPSP
ncbi:MAG: hypothetical protein WCT11_04320 [Candidatus Magasanikbacteria bacterium]